VQTYSFNCPKGTDITVARSSLLTHLTVLKVQILL
jgi:hypothetical protein